VTSQTKQIGRLKIKTLPKQSESEAKNAVTFAADSLKEVFDKVSRSRAV